MGEGLESFEQQDVDGSTVHYGASISSNTSIPSSAGLVISEAWIRNMNNSAANTLQVSFDGGSGYADLRAGESIVWSPKGKRKQILLRTSAGSVTYQAILNFEAF